MRIGRATRSPGAGRTPLALGRPMRGLDQRAIDCLTRGSGCSPSFHDGPRPRARVAGRDRRRGSPILHPSTAGQRRSRETSAISASATTHLARATASFGPKARAALRERTFARPRSPSRAIGISRSASAVASWRKATRFNAPRGSPAASARAAAVMNESVGILPHLSLSPFNARYLSLTRPLTLSRSELRAWMIRARSTRK